MNGLSSRSRRVIPQIAIKHAMLFASTAAESREGRAYSSEPERFVNFTFL
jgi:hypothetical protein